jgi:hypothetical protein
MAGLRLRANDSAREAAWAASPYAVKAAPSEPKGARLGFVERIGAIALFLVLVLIPVTVDGLHSSSAAANNFAAGRAALARGDQRAAVRAWRDVLRTAPRSLSALVLTSCAGLLVTNARTRQLLADAGADLAKFASCRPRTPEPTSNLPPK